MQSTNISFYKNLSNINGVGDIDILLETETSVLGKYKYKDLLFGFLDTSVNDKTLNIFTNILKFSFNIKIPNKKIDKFKKSLSDLINNKIREIPTILIQYKYKDGEVSFDLTNQIPYESEINNSENIIYPMIELLYLARVQIVIFLLECKKNDYEG